jgi:hypothetical protein
VISLSRNIFQLVVQVIEAKILKKKLLRDLVGELKLLYHHFYPGEQVSPTFAQATTTYTGRSYQ